MVEESSLMSKLALVGMGLAAVVAGTAAADQAVSLGNNSLVASNAGGSINFNEYNFVLSGTLTDFTLNFNYVDGNPSSWASDMIIQIIAPNGGNAFWGGTNVNPTGSTDKGVWSFDGSASTVSGPYSDNSNLLGVTNLSGAGTWKIRILNGWTGAVNACGYNDVNLNLIGVVPAPGAVALLGLAGLVGRRRRS